MTRPWRDGIPRRDGGAGRSGFVPRLSRVSRHHARLYGLRAAPEIRSESVTSPIGASGSWIRWITAAMPANRAHVLVVGRPAPTELVRQRPLWRVSSPGPEPIGGPYDAVLGEGLFHTVANPGPLLDALAAVLVPGGRLLVRDLRRPVRALRRLHLAWYGRHLDAAARAHAARRVDSAFTIDELALIVAASPFEGATVDRHGPYLTLDGRIR